MEEAIRVCAGPPQGLSKITRLPSPITTLYHKPLFFQPQVTNPAEFKQGGWKLYGICYNKNMETTGGNISISLIAVEVSKFCLCHRLVLARQNDAHSWFYFFVKEPSWIEFGDRLLYYPATQDLFQDRNLTLTYRAQLDLIPQDVAIDLCKKLPYPEMYPEEPGGIVFEPPQGG